MIADQYLAPAAFDAAAASYDAGFTHTPLGRVLRELVWQRIERYFQPGMHVLELNCGTGEDAVWLARRGISVLATDGSAEMVSVARKKVAQAGVASQIEVRQMAIEELAGLIAGGPFDGVLSNFGGLNCIADRQATAQALARWLQPGALVALGVMGPVCPWEIAWFGLHLRPAEALRRLRPGGVLTSIGAGKPLRVYYPSSSRVQREFQPWFDLVDVRGIGVALPPSYLGWLANHRPRLLGGLRRLDVALSRIPGQWLQDHYLMILRRNGEC